MQIFMVPTFIYCARLTHTLYHIQTKKTLLYHFFIDLAIYSFHHDRVCIYMILKGVFKSHHSLGSYYSIKLTS